MQSVDGFSVVAQSVQRRHRETNALLLDKVFGYAQWCFFDSHLRESVNCENITFVLPSSITIAEHLLATAVLTVAVLRHLTAANTGRTAQVQRKEKVYLIKRVCGKHCMCHLTMLPLSVSYAQY